MQHAADNDKELKNNSKPAWFKVNCYVQWFPFEDQQQGPMYYHACTVCKKKLLEEHAGYRCQHCQCTYTEYNLNYNFSVRMGDYSDTMYV
jgi:hypothetical protein